MKVDPELEGVLLAFVADEFLAAEPDVLLGPEDDLLGSGYVDSLGVMRVVQFLEGRFGVRVSPLDITLENFLTVRRIAAYVGTLLATTAVPDHGESS